LLDFVACFHRADAPDALQLHFGMPPEVVRDCLSKSNIASLYARHRMAAQAYLRKVDRLVDCSTSSTRQSNRRRLGEASVMDLMMELRKKAWRTRHATGIKRAAPFSTVSGDTIG
jgi:hypothetical protein